MSAEVRFQQLYDAHYPDVMRYCLRRTSRDDAPDVASEVFAVTWRRIEDVPEGESSLPWLYRVAANALANHRRSQRRRLHLVTKLGGLSDATSPGPEHQIVRRAESEEVLTALARLRAADQEVLRLSAWEGLSATHIAERFEISVAAAEKRLARAKARLAKVLPDRSGTSTTPPLQEGGNR